MLLTSIFFLVMIFAIVGFIKNDQYRYLYNSIASCIGFLLMILVFQYSKYKLEGYKVLLIILTILSHTILGQYFELYNKSFWFDRVLHVIGTFTLSLFLYSILIQTFSFSSDSKTLIVIFVASLGISSGSLFETIEFTLDIISGSNNQRSLFNTNFDLIANVIGAIFAGFFTAYFEHKKSHL